MKANTFRAILICLTFFIARNSCAQSIIPEKATDISPLLIGEMAPDLVLKNSKSGDVKLTDLIKSRPTVLIFYRGGWCPYCNLHLAELQTIEQQILELGYQIIAISPDSPSNLRASIEKHKLNYSLLSDADMELSKAFGLAYSVPEASRERLNKASDGRNTGMLPVPSVFVFNQLGEIMFEYINPDYKKRLKGNMLLAVLKELKQ